MLGTARAQADAVASSIGDAASFVRRGAEKPSLAERFPGAQPPRLLPERYFSEYVRREHLRAVRSKQHLAVAILSLNSATQTTPVDLYNLSKILQLLVRETDVLGWYGENAIAILLADTDDRGAKECIRRIQARTMHLPVKCEIRAYSELERIIATTRDQVSSDSSPLVAPDPSGHSRSTLVLKRGLDIFGAILSMILLSPVMLLAALAVKATSRGPIIFRQVRVGHKGAPFIFYKFRSMRVDVGFDSHRNYVQSFIRGKSSELTQGDAHQPFYKIKTDPRVTPVGRFLRKCSIDELPQLFNVLRGEMSLVGPRPPIPYEVEAYSAWHLRRILEVKPGLTGLWQVEGRSAVSFDDMVRLDLRYARNWSILLDLKILLKTVKVVIQCRGSG
ncbi:MAG: sugar transferase [Pseudomonadota bacterium]|nr:sugar transferase [Pseudomonadota bacterium]